MSSFGSTESKKEGDLSDEDIQALSLDDMRGAYKDMHKAKLSLNEAATVEGCLQAVDIVKQQIEMQAEQMNRIIGMHQTLSAEFAQYKQQRVIELQSWLATGGSTTPEDNDGSST